jgi:hypothetical protein
MKKATRTRADSAAGTVNKQSETQRTAEFVEAAGLLDDHLGGLPGASSGRFRLADMNTRRERARRHLLDCYDEAMRRELQNSEELARLCSLIEGNPLLAEEAAALRDMCEGIRTAESLAREWKRSEGAKPGQRFIAAFCEMMEGAGLTNSLPFLVDLADLALARPETREAGEAMQRIGRGMACMDAFEAAMAEAEADAKAGIGCALRRKRGKA